MPASTTGPTPEMSYWGIEEIEWGSSCAKAEGAF